MKIQHNVDLTAKNTMKVPAIAAEYAVASSIEDIKKFVDYANKNRKKIFVLGEGSNILLTKDVDGIVMRLTSNQVKKIDETSRSITFKVDAGKNWHELVLEMVKENYGGIENLSLIPGTVGAAPIQNIAAYGQAIEDTLISVEYLDIETNTIKVLTNKECRFSYRSSIFKNELKDKAIVTAVTLTLQKHSELNTSYYSKGARRESITSELQAFATKPYSVKDVSDAVIRIRTRKMLDWKAHPTVGSFFVNPVVTKEKYEELKKLDTELQAYPLIGLSYVDKVEGQLMKIPVGRLLDFYGWKGKQIGHVFVSKDWASIISHDGQATGKEIVAFIEEIKKDILAKTGIELETEVNII